MRPISMQTRTGQRAVARLVTQGLIRQAIDSHKVDNAYTLTAAAKTFIATRYPEQAAPRRRDDRPSAEALR